MPMTVNEKLVPLAVVAFGQAKDAGLDDAAAWHIAVDRVRREVLQMAAVVCELQASEYDADSTQAAACLDCSDAIYRIASEDMDD